MFGGFSSSKTPALFFSLGVKFDSSTPLASQSPTNPEPRPAPSISVTPAFSKSSPVLYSRCFQFQSFEMKIELTWPDIIVIALSCSSRYLSHNVKVILDKSIINSHRSISTSQLISSPYRRTQSHMHACRLYQPTRFDGLTQKINRAAAFRFFHMISCSSSER